MFGFFGAEVVQYIGLKGQTITFRSKKRKVKVGRTMKIQLAVPVDNGIEKVKLGVLIQSFRPLPDTTGSIVSGHAMLEEPALQSLATLLSTVERPDLGRAARRSERVPVSLRVMSPEVPGYRGVTVDVSLHGVQLALEGPMDPGSYLNVTIEMGMAQIPQLTVQGVVVWCRDGGARKSYLVGIELTQQHPQVEELWGRAYQNLVVREKGSVLQRSLADGEFLIREEETGG